MSTPSVLIFDRDAHSGSSLRDLLATWGYHPIVADDIPGALKAVDELKPALVLDGGPAGDSAFVRQIREQYVDLSVVPLERPVDPFKLRTLIDRTLELDLAMTKDGILVVSHDSRLNPAARRLGLCFLSCRPSHRLKC